MVFGSSLRVRRASDERRRVAASITFVSVAKETSARGRLVGSARAVHRRSRLHFGTGDWFAFGEPFFVACLPQLTHCLGTGSCPNHRLSAVGLSYALETINSTPRSRRSVVDEEAILGGLRSGEDLPDYDYEEFEAGSAGQDRRVMIPIGTHPEAVAGTLTMETTAFSVRPPMMSKDEGLAPIGAAPNQVSDKDIWTSSVWR